MRNAARNILWVFSGDLFRRFIGFLTVIVIARRGGTEGFGMYSIAFTLLTYGIMLAMGGLHLRGVRDSAQGSGAHLAGRIIGARLVCSLAVFAIMAAAMVAVRSVLQREIILVTAVAMFPNALFLDWYFQGGERLRYTVLARSISAIVYLGFIALLVRGTESILWVGVGMVVGDSLAAVAFLRWFRADRVPVDIRLSPAEWWPLFRESFPLGLGTLLGALSVNFPPVAIGALMSASDAGIFSAASKLVIVLLVADRVIGQVFVPATSRIYVTDRPRFAPELSRALKWVLLITLPVAVGGTILSARLIDLVYGGQFAAAAPLFRVAVWYFPLTLLHTIFTAGLVAIHAEQRYGRVMVWSAILYFGFTIAGVAFLGTMGAAIGVVAAEAITLIAMMAAFLPIVPLPVPAGLWGIVVATALMAAVVQLLSLPILASLAAGAITYALVVLVLRVVTPSELVALVKQP